MLLLAALKALVLRYSGSDDVIVCATAANRERVELYDVVGGLWAVLNLRTDLSGDPTFAQLLHRVRDTTLDAYANQGVEVNYAGPEEDWCEQASKIMMMYESYLEEGLLRRHEVFPHIAVSHLHSTRPI